MNTSTSDEIAEAVDRVTEVLLRNTVADCRIVLRRCLTALGEPVFPYPSFVAGLPPSPKDGDVLVWSGHFSMWVPSPAAPTHKESK